MTFLSDMNNVVHLMDCMEGMKQFPDKYFELAIVDPPYGNNLSGGRSASNNWNNSIDWDKCNKGWNKNIPDINYFNDLFRVSKNQIIWGGNYFSDKLPPSEGWIIWDKGQREFSLADGEMAWSSYDKALRIFDYSRAKANRLKEFHPTEKPVALYKWLLRNYAKPGDKILDTHVGSGSSRIACYDGGFDFTGYEIDADYHAAQEKRFQQHIAQLKLLI